MYLRGSKWNMNKRSRRRSSPWRVFALVAMIFGVLYVNRYVIPNTPGLSAPTPTPTLSAEAFINEAETLISQGKFLKAIDSYQNAIHSNPENRSIYASLARVQIFAGQYEQAKESAQRALIGNEEYALGQTMLAWSEGYLANYPEAEAAIKKAIDLDNNSAVAHAVYAEILIDDPDAIGGVEKASEESKVALRLAPNSFEVLRARGYVLYRTGNYQESIDAYQAAIALNKYIPDLYMNLGTSYQSLETPDYDKAMSALLQAKVLSPTDPLPDVELSRILAKLGDYEKAAQYAESAVKEDPTNPKRYGNLGWIYYWGKQYTKAADAFTCAIRGCATKDGQTVEGMALRNDDSWIIQYYTLYAFALAKVSPQRCNDSVQVFQLLLNAFPDDQGTIDTVNSGLDLCKPGAKPTESAQEGAAAP